MREWLEDKAIMLGAIVIVLNGLAITLVPVFV